MSVLYAESENISKDIEDFFRAMTRKNFKEEWFGSFWSYVAKESSESLIASIFKKILDDEFRQIEW